MIAYFQKKVLFEEAVKKGFVLGSLADIPEIFEELVGPTDIGRPVFGAPLAPLYMARPRDPIDVLKIDRFVTGAFRDLDVLDLSASELEKKLALVAFETWILGADIRARAASLKKSAQALKERLSSRAEWVYTETFKDTSGLDMQSTTLWVDVSEGVAVLPEVSAVSTIPPASIYPKVVEVAPRNRKFVGAIENVCDGVESAVWGVLFVEDSPTTIALEFPEAPLTSITVDPLGFGMSLEIDLLKGNEWVPLVSDTIYSKSTYPVESIVCSEVRLRFRPAASVLPKVSGFRNITLRTGTSSEFGSVYTTQIQPPITYSEIKGVLDVDKTDSGEVSLFAKTGDGGSWVRLSPDSWISIADSTSERLTINYSQLSGDNGYYVHPLSTMLQPRSRRDGLLTVGAGQVKVETVFEEASDSTASDRLLYPETFKNTGDKLTIWAEVPDYDGDVSVTPLVSNVSQANALLPVLETSCIFSRNEDGESIPTLTIVPYCSGATLLQPGQNYRIYTEIYCSKAITIEYATLRLFQGVRKDGARSYADTRSSLCSVSIAVNGEVVAGTSSPITIFESGTEVEDPVGDRFDIRLQAGWNTFEILIAVYEPGMEDNLNGFFPFVEIDIFPNLFDRTFMLQNSIAAFRGGGEYQPKTPFDVTWNSPVDISNWAWTPNLDGIVFNTNPVKTMRKLNGFLSRPPRAFVKYVSRSIAQTSPPITLRADISRNFTSTTSPVLKSITLLVR